MFGVVFRTNTKPGLAFSISLSLFLCVCVCLSLNLSNRTLPPPTIISCALEDHTRNQDNTAAGFWCLPWRPSLRFDHLAFFTGEWTP